MRIRLKRLVVAMLAAVAAPAAALAALLAWPQPLFAFHVERGTLQLWSDERFDPDDGQALLAEVERRIAATPFHLDGSVHRVFVANEGWRYRLTFPWSAGAGGVNYYPLRNVFLRHADIARDRLFGPSGREVPPPRTLAYYAAHEIGHSLIGARVGMIENQRLPVWIREGLADYIGFGGAVDVEDLAARLKAGDRDLDPARSRTYTRYRLLAAFMLTREGWDLDRLLASHLPQAEAERRLSEAMRGSPDRSEESCIATCSGGGLSR